MRLRWMPAHMLATMLGLTAAVAAQAVDINTSATGTLKGVLRDPQGALATGLVTLKNPATRLERSAHTDAAHAFVFRGLEAGGYQLTAVAEGFAPATASATVTAGQETTVEITLKIAPVHAHVEVNESGRAAIAPASETGARNRNAAELIGEAEGVSLRQNGTLASAPIVHGLGEERVKLEVDGAIVSSACANHMNPPLSYVAPAAVRHVTVLAGATPVSEGGDSLGGTIAVESRGPAFAAAGERVHVESEGGGFYRSNNENFGGDVFLSLGGRNVAAAYAGGWRQNGNYTDGAGHKVTSTYAQSTDHTLTLALRGVGQQFTVAGGIHHVPYQGFVNAQMDMTRNWAERLNASYRRSLGAGSLEARGWWQGTWHTMNIGHDKSTFPMPMFMPMQTHGRDSGANLRVELPRTARQTLRAGIEAHWFRLDDWWPPVTGAAPSMAPDTFLNIHNGRRTRLGEYAELASQWSPRWSTTLGLRADTVWTDADAVHGYSDMYAADAAAFNARKRAHTDTSPEATATARWEPRQTVSLEFGYAHKGRAPNLYERYAWSKNWMAAGMIGWFGDGNYYVGSTALKPERADTASGAVTLRAADGERWQARVAPFITHIDNLIDANTLATARYGMSNFAMLQFANSEARTLGGDVSANGLLWREAGTGRVSFRGGWLRGRRLDANTPLYQMMPVHGRVSLDEEWRQLAAGLGIEMVDRKRDLDPRRFEQTTAGYTLVDAHLAWKRGPVEARGGVENLFNRLYQPPLGGVNFDDFMRGMWMGAIKPVTGEGRSVSIEMKARF